jgi:carbon monoxide dehydrogenase subunit G
MGQRIEERFAVRAPVEKVWAYLVDPRRVVTCLPGAELTEVVDERTFHGAVKVKVGPVTVSYKGKVILEEVDAAARRVRMTGEGRESTGTGSARMAMESTLTELPSGEVEVKVVSDVDVVGRLVQLGRGMIEQVSHQLFAQFAGCVKATLEAEAQAAAPADAAGGAPAGAAPLPVAQPVKIVPLVLGALWAVIQAFLGRLTGKR